MIFDNKRIGKTRLESSTFESSCRKEAHFMGLPIPEATGRGFSEQLRSLVDGWKKWAADNKLTPVMKRVFLSDVANQADEVRKALADIPGALSIVGQPPLGEIGVKVALMAIATGRPDAIISEGEMTLVRRGPYTDLWTTTLSGHREEGSYTATNRIFTLYDRMMAKHGMSLADNCLRTWFYVRDIDNRYEGMVTSRNEVFSNCGLTRDTHFIASTGIEGTGPLPGSVVTFDALAVKGLHPSQTRYLNAPTHLNPTSEYGVAFERATSVDYGDRRMVFVSGTASIDNRGKIVAPGDIAGQTRRMTENVLSLLEKAGCGGGDIAHIILYIRDIADCRTATGIVRRAFPDVPLLCVNAAVCRPGWLVEMECMAIARISMPEFAPY